MIALILGGLVVSILIVACLALVAGLVAAHFERKLGR